MEKPLYIRAGRILTPFDEISDGALVCRGGRITFLGLAHEAPPPEDCALVALPDYVLAPGFIDLHVHGGGGHWWGQDQAKNAAIARRLAATGTTSCLASLGGRRDFRHCLDAIENTASLVGRDLTGTRLLGIHMEGPFINPVRRGAWHPDQLRPPSLDDFGAICSAAAGTVRTITIAPELEGANAVIRRAQDNGVRPAIGHSDATYEQAVAGIESGVTLATHTYNAMRGLHHRDPGVVGAILTRPEVDAELIADGQHVAEGAIRVLLASRPTERVILVTDNVALAGAEPGVHGEGRWKVTVTDSGVTMADGTIAGSVLPFNRHVASMARIVGIAQALAMATVNPARAIGVDGHKGSLAVGKDADLVALDEDFNVCLTVSGGRIIHEARGRWDSGRADSHSTVPAAGLQRQPGS
jgi:N-acetylglucosamine-6-phosphate deacetylase